MAGEGAVLLSRASSSIVAVTSTVRNSVTCGAVNALDHGGGGVLAHAPDRGPGLGRRGQLGPRDRAGLLVPRPPVQSGCRRLDILAGDESASPVPATSARSTPRSWASLRTGGVERGRSGAPVERRGRVATPPRHPRRRGIEVVTRGGVGGHRRPRSARVPPARAALAGRSARAP